MSEVIQLSPKSTAALIRLILRRAFPAAKFSVSTNRGAGVSSVSVRWTDGPTPARVAELVDVFESGSFNGMTDGYEYLEGNDRLIVVGDVVYRKGCRYISTSREISPALAKRCAAQVAAYYGLELPKISTTKYGNWEVENDRTFVVGSDCWSNLIYRAASNAQHFTRIEA